ncbi:hypothetical protein [Pseudomonas phage Achelous]|uniref:Uncharacterized protein n=1 Tax=Pseudomonas phage Achelous TaxID=2163982 RepID=A0A2S1GMR5_9CAUD|nr:hypothetical protein HOT10_gp04 [Pseudomonas phage Achelous]AWD90681.1 hypothetical protein [Pseudomonas phage Achelous]
MTIENTNFADLPAATRMEEIVIEINQSLDNIQTESVKVGKLLTEANCEFKEQGKKGADFLEWAFTHFSIKKAQAYKLMTVAEHFGADDRFQGVSMRVLYALATQADDDVIDKAAELAANNSLTTTTLNLLLNPAPVEPKKQQIDENKNEGDAALLNVPNAPESTPSGVQQTPSAPVADGAGVAGNEANEALASANAALLEQVAALTAQLKEMQEAQVRFNASKAAPSLPQFKHKNPCVVLGLSEDDAKSATKIKAAFRGLVSAGYGNEHEAFDKLVAARDSLLNAE